MSSLPAEAQFPGTDITLWDEHQAKGDRRNPVYLEIHKLVQKKKYDQAMTLIDNAHRDHPEKGTPLILKSLLLFELKRYDESYAALQQGRSIQRRHPAVSFAHCRIYRIMGNVELSEQACKIAVHQHPDSKETHYQYAQTLTTMGYMELANKELERAAELDAAPETGVCHRHRDVPGVRQQATRDRVYRGTRVDPENIAARAGSRGR